MKTKFGVCGMLVVLSMAASMPRVANAQCGNYFAQAGPYSTMTGHEIGYDPIRDQMLILSGYRSFTDPALNPTRVATQIFDSGGYQLSSEQMIAPRFGHRIVFDRASKELLLLGGVEPILPGFYIPNPNSVWNGVSWQTLQNNWAVFPYGNSQQLQGAAYDEANSRVLIVSSGTVLARVGTSWVAQSPRNTALQNRIYVDSAFDQRRNRLVLHGGVDSLSGQRPSETWEWDGATWTLIPTAVNPGPREDSRMVYDERAQRVMLFGGYDGSRVKGDLWSWDGSTWSLIVDTPSIARAQCAIAWDSKYQRIVIQGGYVVSGPTFATIGDSWEWDGSAWLPGRLGGGPASIVAGTYDVRGRRVVVIGGTDARETWYYDGVWSKGPSTPGSRSVYALSYDAERDEVVLTGGTGAGTWVLANDTWTVFVPTATGAVANIGAQSVGYDPIRRRLVTIQNFGANNYELTWTGQGWDSRPIAGIVGGSGTWMATNWATGRLWYFRAVGSQLDVREFDGTQWATITNTQPSDFNATAWFYDAAREQMIASESLGNSLVFRQAAWDGTAWVRLNTLDSSPLFPIVNDLARHRNLCFRNNVLSATRPLVPIGPYRTSVRQCLAGNARLDIPLANTDPVTIEWRRADTGQPITNGMTADGTVVQGADTPSLRLLGVRANDATRYYCRIIGVCGPTVTRDIQVLMDRCVADADCNGSATVPDIFEYLNLWFAGDQLADIDGTPGTQSADLFAFLDAWFTGC